MLKGIAYSLAGLGLTMYSFAMVPKQPTAVDIFLFLGGCLLGIVVMVAGSTMLVGEKDE